MPSRGGCVKIAGMIRSLEPADIERLIELRREALLAQPSAFSSSPDGDLGLDPGHLRAAMSQRSSHGLFGAFDSELVGMAGVHRHAREKEAHKAELSGMYVRPAHRRRGLGGALLAACVERARSWPGVSQLHLAVSADAEAARRLYESNGFTVWGSEPAGLVVAGRPMTVHHMVLPLAG
jgi:RimJ/RimL family protein N-acetyltransferase